MSNMYTSNGLIDCFIYLLLAACCFIWSPAGVVLAHPADKAATSVTIPSVTCILFRCVPFMCNFPLI